MRTNIFVIGVEVGVVESYGSGKRVNMWLPCMVNVQQSSLTCGSRARLTCSNLDEPPK